MTLGGGDDQADPPVGETKKWGLGVSEKRERGGRWLGWGEEWAGCACGPREKEEWRSGPKGKRGARGWKGWGGPSGQKAGGEVFFFFLLFVFFLFLLFQSHFKNKFENILTLIKVTQYKNINDLA